MWLTYEYILIFCDSHTNIETRYFLWNCFTVEDALNYAHKWRFNEDYKTDLINL